MGQRLIPTQTNFTGGEIDELLDGRVDLTKYNNSVKLMQDMIPFPQGGGKGRAGLRFVAETKDSSRQSILLRFTFNTSQQYILEVGHQYIRFFTNSGRLESPPGTPVEVATTYQEADLFNLKFIGQADVLIIQHPSYPTKALKRLSATSWSFTDYRLDPPPSVEADTDLATTLTLSAASVGSGRTATAGAAVFFPADVDRQIVSGAGVATIAAIPAGPYPVNSVTVDILEAFAGTNLASGAWFITGSPAAGLQADKKSPVGAKVTMTLDKEGTRTVDVGKYVRVFGGVIKITERTSATVWKGTILLELSDWVDATTNALSGTWTLEIEAFSASRGYPRTATFAERRLWLAGTIAEPDSLFASQSGKFNKFPLGPKDDAALRYSLGGATDELNAIEWIINARDILVGTSGEEFRVKGGQDDVITPDSISVKSQTSWGSEPVQPIKVDNAVIFVQRGGTILRSLAYNFDADGYLADDLMLLARSQGKTGIRQIWFSKTPVPIIWGIRNDGVLITLTYDPRQEVFAWAHHGSPNVFVQGAESNPTGDAVFESGQSIIHPEGNRWQTWVIVKRQIGIKTRRNVEFFDEAEDAIQNHKLHLDSALSYDGTVNTSNVTPGAVAQGTSTTFTASSAIFSSADVNKEIRQIKTLGTGDLKIKGRATITAFIDTTHVVATIAQPFDTIGVNPATIPSGSWGLAVKKVSGLSHLLDTITGSGGMVSIVGDGAVYPLAQVVTPGEVTLNGPFALKIDVGIGFVPTLTTLRPGANLGEGNIVFLTKGYSKLFVLLKDSLGAEVNGDQVPFRSSADKMDEAPPISTAIHEVSLTGYDRDQRVTIRQPQPLPINILAIQGILEVGDE